jgi:hypothetical protein
MPQPEAKNSLETCRRISRLNPGIEMTNLVSVSPLNPLRITCEHHRLGETRGPCVLGYCMSDNGTHGESPWHLGHFRGADCFARGDENDIVADSNVFCFGYIERLSCIYSVLALSTMGPEPWAYKYWATVKTFLDKLWSQP